MTSSWCNDDGNVLELKWRLDMCNEANDLSSLSNSNDILQSTLWYSIKVLNENEKANKSWSTGKELSMKIIFALQQTTSTSTWLQHMILDILTTFIPFIINRLFLNQVQVCHLLEEALQIYITSQKETMKQKVKKKFNQ